ncbi:MAG TPA: SpoIID/LytB domain-containing protein [Anaeromyxobacteraceae bacterium]|nr:SpoIID/LytB domain-containing protein [Anaeromyxobacteraceae bacterium]
MRKHHLLLVAAVACATGRGPAPVPAAVPGAAGAEATEAAPSTATAASTATATAPSTATAASTATETAPSTASTPPTATPTPASPSTLDLAAGLPPPLPPPEWAAPSETPASPATEPDDPLELLWNHRLEFTQRGQPLVTIRLAEGLDEIAFRPRAKARIALRGAPPVEVEGGARLRVRARGALPASLAWWPLLFEASAAERRRVEDARRAWEARGVRVRVRWVGGVYGISGRVVDNRRELLLADGDGGEAWARATVERLRARGERPGLHTEVVRRPSGELRISGAGGTAATADGALSLEVEGDAGFTLEGVPREGAREREDRTYRGRLLVAVDARGKLAAVLAIPLEDLLRGLVPSEMPASVHPEALKAQAVTARSNVLAQIGTRHLTDPYMLCAEVHCQAYLGQGAETARTDEAVRATAGEALFRKEDRTLVDAVYSAMCGGHGEDNEAVWGNAPDPSLRGRLDAPRTEAGRWAASLRDDGALRAFLDAGPGGVDAWCRRATLHRPEKFRWERRIPAADADALVAALGVGRLRLLEVAARGVSGRARVLRVVGDAGQAEVQGELRIRRLLGNLPSAMFVVERDGDAFVLRGGGWGHGAGMCQWGAVGRADAGQDYRTILRAYYSGAEVARIY